jgi:hypothetical protein
MLEITLNWKPDPQTLTQLVQVALLEQKSLESLLDEAIAQYLQANFTPNPISASPTPPDPFLGGLYDGRGEWPLGRGEWPFAPTGHRSIDRFWINSFTINPCQPSYNFHKNREVKLCQT